jgi:hypothetical protein
MRTTLKIDDDVMTLARSLAEGRRISIGEAISYLARRGATVHSPQKIRNDFHLFAVEPDALAFGPADVRTGLEAEDEKASAMFLAPRP